jgi:hypothetical protein
MIIRPYRDRRTADGALCARRGGDVRTEFFDDVVAILRGQRIFDGL